MKTRITELLGIKHPIIQAGMSYVAYPPLVAAVSEAGGLGILGAQPMSPEELRQSIREIRQRTDKPFGVNFLAYNPRMEELIDVMIEEKVAVASYGRGNPQRIIERCKPAGIICLPTIGALKHAHRAVRDGADAVIVQGLEAGGHASYVATSVLVPLIASSIKIPVVAAGGFADGRGLVAALAWGAEGISMGTRFAITQECPVPLHIKQRYAQNSEEDTAITDKVTGTRCRGLKNKLTDALEREKGWGLSPKAIGGLFSMARQLKVPIWRVILSGFQLKTAEDVSLSRLSYSAFGGERMMAALISGDGDLGFMPGGQVCGRIRDIPTCQQLIERIVAEAEAILKEIEAKIRA